MFLLSDRVKNEKLLSCTWRAGPGPHAYVRKGALFLIRSRRQRDHICLRTKSDPALISAPHLPLCRLTPHTCAPCPGLSFRPGTSQFLDVEFSPWAFASLTLTVYFYHQHVRFLLPLLPPHRLCPQSLKACSLRTPVISLAECPPTLFPRRRMLAPRWSTPREAALASSFIPVIRRHLTAPSARRPSTLSQHQHALAYL